MSTQLFPVSKKESMYNIIPFTKPWSYTENSQRNNLRWTILYRDSETQFTEQAGIMKCKDYFNDLVAAYNNLYFNAYGFRNETVKLNEEGVYLRLSNMEYKDNLIYNLGTINKQANNQGLPSVEMLDLDDKLSCIIFVPKPYWENTYFVSFLTYLIRIAHSPQTVDSYADLINGNINSTRIYDCPFSVGENKYADLIFKNAFKLPHENLKDFPWILYPTIKQNLSMAKHELESIHNNGVWNWLYYLNMYRNEIEKMEEVTA